MFLTYFRCLPDVQKPFDSLDRWLTSVSDPHTMFARTQFLVLAVSIVSSVSACGGGSGSSNNAESTACTVGTKSTPGMPDDPCSQTYPACVAISGHASAPCGADGHWGQCVCETAATSAGTGSVPPLNPCGNHILDPGEECEPGLTSATCAMLLPGTVGLVNCSATCKLDTMLCVAPTTPVATGGTGATATAGQAGTGR
jgi:hypothetical protein